MADIKLQAGCFAIVIYMIVYYSASNSRNGLKCNRFYDLLLGISPWAIFFDGATAWTVNHLDIVPRSINLFLHGCFLFTMSFFILLSFIYMCDISIGLGRDNKMLDTVIILFIIVEMVSMFFLKDLEFVIGVNTNYSMGISVKLIYGMFFVYFALMLIAVIYHKKQIEKKKYISIITCILIA